MSVEYQEQSSNALPKLALFSFVFLPLTLYLGFWQLERADHKTLLIAQEANLSRLAPLSISQLTGQVPENYRPVRLRGRYEPEHFLLDNKLNQGKVGYEVLSLFTVEGGQQLLVNRGWIAAPRYRTEFPVVADAALAQTVLLQGYFYQSDGDLPLLDDFVVESSESSEWPKRIPAVDWQEIEVYLPHPLSWHKQFRLADEAQAGAMHVDWPVTNMSPAKHLAYAWQWFALSAALVILSVTAYFKIRQTTT